jgi:uncharacterized protein (UPF0333 family)
MLVSYFSPLAPAAVLLLGAFILPFVFFWLPERWQARRVLRAFGPPGVVLLVMVVLFGTRLTLGPDPTGEGLVLLSGWDFSTIESVGALTIRADALSLSFLILILLILLAITLVSTPWPSSDAGEEKQELTVSGWLVMGAAASLLFVSGNGLTISYAVFIFDLLTLFYWLGRGQIDLGVARLFLGILTATGLALATVDLTGGPFLLGLSLWLRLGLYPLFETTVLFDEDDYSTLVYLALSLTIGLYLMIRTVVMPLPDLILWLTVITMVGAGLWAWLTENRSLSLLRLGITAALLIVVAGFWLPEELAMAYSLGLLLSLVALWITPRLGKPDLKERAWLWPYFPALGATLTLLGVPFSLTWPVYPVVYQSLLALDQFFMVVLVIFAQGAALSALVRYWLMLWQGVNHTGRQAAAGVVIMVPFLVPGLAPLVLFGLTRTAAPTAALEQPLTVFAGIVALIVIVFSLAFFRPQLMSRLEASPVTLTRGIGLSGVRLQESASWISKVVLRTEVFLQGQHYVAWALFTALLGGLIILLGT